VKLDLSGAGTTTLYIAGPMSGLPDLNYPAFFHAESKLAECGYLTLNPARNSNPDPEDYIEWLRLGLRQVLEADGVAVLPGFGMSKGAVMEIMVASFLKMPVRTINEWLEMRP